MARRKRASLKDKGPETLGLTPKKGRGMDVLFGGPLEKSTSTSTSSTPSGADKINDASQPKSKPATTATPERSADELSDLEEQATVAPPAAPAIAIEVSETLPVNEADDDEAGIIVSSEEVDELGLPVAMEAPPEDLEFAMPPTELAADTGEKDAFDPSLSPFAAPSPTPADVETLPAVDVDDDLSGLLEEEDLSGLLAEDDLSGLVSEADVTPTVTTPPPTEVAPEPPPVTERPVTEVSAGEMKEDLSGLTEDRDLSGEAGVGTAPSSTTIPPANLPPAPPPVTAVPAPPSVDTTFQPSTTPAYTPPPAATDVSPAGTPTTSFSMPRAAVESLGGIITERIEVADEDILPEDVAKQVDSSYVIGVKEREKVERDEAIAAEVARYIGRERRENLDKEIERLYNEVAAELSVNTKDAEFALKTLSDAQDIVLEDVRQYDEALYRVAVVKTMLARKRNLNRWSYTWGMFVFFYALVWLAIFIAGFLLTNFIQVSLNEMNVGIQAVRAAWLSALAGGIGGIIGILYSLYWHVAMKQDFDRQYVMYYLVKPVMGFILGAIVYFIVASGFLVFNFAASQGATSTEEVLKAPMVIALQIVLGWIAGFRQRVVFEMIDKIVQRLSSRDKEVGEDDSPVSLVPAEHRKRLSPPGES